MSLKNKTLSIKAISLILLILAFISLYPNMENWKNASVLVVLFLFLNIYVFIIIRQEKKKNEVVFLNTPSKEPKTFNDYVLFILFGLTFILLAFAFTPEILDGDYKPLTILTGPLLSQFSYLNKLPIHIQNDTITFPQFYKKGIKLSEISSAKIIHSGKIEVVSQNKTSTILIPEADTDRLLKLINENIN